MKDWDNVLELIIPYYESIFDIINLDQRVAHPKAHDYIIIGEIGYFKCTEYFNKNEWIGYLEDGTISQELKKRKAMIEYWNVNKGEKTTFKPKNPNF